MKTLRGVCVGAGYFSRFQYEAWARLPAVEIVALANRSLDKAREAAALHRIPRAYAGTDLTTMLATEKSDSVAGRNGHLEPDLEGNLSLQLRGQPTRVLDDPHPRDGFAGDGVCAIQRRCVDRLRDGAPCENTGEVDLKSAARIEACDRSQASHQVVALPA
jgi:predicted dehydrogenase